MNLVRQWVSMSACAASLCFLTACSQSGRGFTVTDSHRANKTDMAESCMSAPADRPRLVEEADAWSQMLTLPTVEQAHGNHKACL